MENKQQKNKQGKNKKNKGKVALNCIFGTLALLGSAGTIAFGTLWCQNRGHGGSTAETITITFNKIGEEYTIEGLPSGQTSMEVLTGTTYGMLPSPKKDEKDFGGWMVNDTLQDPSKTIDSNTTIEPKWVEADEPITINLDTVGSETSEQCVLMATGHTINKNQKIELVTKLSDVPETVTKTYGLDGYFLSIASVEDAPMFHWDCEFYIDNQLISPASYEFVPIIDEYSYYNLSLADEEVCGQIDVESSILRVVITPYEDISNDVAFLSNLHFDIS